MWGCYSVADPLCQTVHVFFARATGIHLSHDDAFIWLEGCDIVLPMKAFEALGAYFADCTLLLGPTVEKKENGCTIPTGEVCQPKHHHPHQGVGGWYVKNEQFFWEGV